MKRFLVSLLLFSFALISQGQYKINPDVKEKKFATKFVGDFGVTTDSDQSVIVYLSDDLMRMLYRKFEVSLHPLANGGFHNMIDKIPYRTGGEDITLPNGIQETTPIEYDTLENIYWVREMYDAKNKDKEIFWDGKVGDKYLGDIMMYLYRSCEPSSVVGISQMVKEGRLREVTKEELVRSSYVQPPKYVFYLRRQ